MHKYSVRRIKMTKEEYNKNRPITICPLCGKGITNACFDKHYKACSNPDSKMNLRLSGKDNVYRLDHDDLKCKFCNNEYTSKNALCQHELRCKLNPNRKAFNNLGNWSHENLLGQTAETSVTVKKYRDSLKRSYDEGKIIKDGGNFNQDFIYLYEKENNQEILKWFTYVNSKKNDIVIPEYETEEFSQNASNNYLILKGSFKITSKTVSAEFEHRYLANLYLDGKLERRNTVHHLDKNKQNNDIYNLIVFETTKEHKRFHTAPRARLKYNEVTHLFNCYLE